MTYLSEMTEQSGPGPAAPLSGEADRPERLPARRRAPWTAASSGAGCRSSAGLLSLFIGITYIIEGISPGARHRLHGVDYLGSVTRTADLIIGLALVMVSHGLRRRKRRAWEATVALLAVGLVSHTVLGLILRHVAPHALRPAIRPAAAVGTALVLLGFIWFRREFYAVGDRGSTVARALGAVLPGRGRCAHRPGLPGPEPQRPRRNYSPWSGSRPWSRTWRASPGRSCSSRTPALTTSTSSPAGSASSRSSSRSSCSCARPAGPAG